MFQLQWERSLVRSIGLPSVGKRREREKENEGDGPDIVGLALGHPVVGHRRTDIGDPTERVDDIDDQSRRTAEMLTVDEDTLTTRMTIQRETETDQETRTERGTERGRERGNQSMM